VTGFATGWSSIRSHLQHAFLELALVRVSVATRAGEILPVIDRARSWFEFGGFLVAVGAWNRDVPARQNEVRLFVASQCERRWLIAFKVVAPVARIEIGRSRELAAVLVAVAIGATLESDFEQSIFALGDVTLRALQSGMPALQRIGRGCVVLHCEPRWFPPFHGVTRSALCARRPLGELPIVWVGFVAIHTLLKSQRLLEVSAAVTLNAVDHRMLSQQRIFRFRVIETLADGFRRNLLPTASVMAGLAALRETSTVRIRVAIGTQREGNPRVTGFVVGSRRVAFLTGDLRMQTGKRIARFRMIELFNLDRLPVLIVVTLQTVGPKPPFVFVLVAGNTGCRNAQEGAVKVLNLNGRALRGRHFVG